jgi:sensor histidine kinase YesM
MTTIFCISLPLAITQFSSSVVILSAIIVLILLLTLHVTLFFLRIKDKRKIIALEQRLLLSQMNPHFVFNSLTAIQSYIFRKDPYQAGKYLANFAKLVRLILENSRLENISIARERETITHYLELQALRFEGKFDYNIEISQEIDEEHLYIPPMLSQPFIENAIEHGIIHLSSKGLINIRFSICESLIILEVEDNGVGIEASAESNSKKREEHKSLATRITQERLKNLRKVYGQRIKMEVNDIAKTSLNGSRGTLVKFTIPQIIK